MASYLIEKQNTVQYPRDGALLNFHSIGKQNGRLRGATIYQVTKGKIQLTPGVLIIRGYRVFIDNYEVMFDKTLTPTPTVDTKYYIFFRIRASTVDALLDIIVSATPPQYSAKIEQIVGIYDYLLGTFYYGPNGINQFISTILDVDTTVAQDPEGGGEQPPGEYELAENKIDLWSDGFSGPGSGILFPTERLVKEGLNTKVSKQQTIVGIKLDHDITSEELIKGLDIENINGGTP